MISVNELFSGIGAFRKALERLNIPHKIVGISEIDKYAIKSYEAMFGQTRNYGDISKIDKLDYADLWTYGFPCQDISIAGHQEGIVKGETRSGLLYEVQRLLSIAADKNELPKYLILENVKNLVGKKFIRQFESWLQWLDDLGYNNYWQVINAKDCEVPQNRERVFVVSIRKEIDSGFAFSNPLPLQWSMFDYLEDNAEEKYYLSNAYIKYAKELTERMSKNKRYGIKFEPRERERERESRIIAKTITTKAGQRVTDNFIIEWEETPMRCKEVGSLSGGRWDKMYEQSRRVYDPEGLSPTIHTCGGGNQEIKVMVMDNETMTRRIRKLTPRECWRLMGFDDADFNKVASLNSDTQLYKQAGNSIVVNVLEGILRNLLSPSSPREQAQSILDWLDEVMEVKD